MPLSHTVGVGANVTLPKGGSLQVDQASRILAAYLYQLFPVDDPDSGWIDSRESRLPDRGNDSYSYNTRLALSFGSARGTRVTTSGTFSRTDYSTAGRDICRPRHIRGGRRDRASRFAWRALGRVRLSQRRIWVWRSDERASPDSRRGVLAGAFQDEARDISRRTHAHAIRRLRSRCQTRPSTARSTRSNFALSGEASAAYPFRPNWRATARYRRDMEYLSVLGQPVVSDAARVELTGLLARRVDLSSVGRLCDGGLRRWTKPRRRWRLTPARSRSGTR